MTPKDRRLLVSICLALLCFPVFLIYKLIRVIAHCFYRYDQDGYIIKRQCNSENVS